MMGMSIFWRVSNLYSFTFILSRSLPVTSGITVSKVWGSSVIDFVVSSFWLSRVITCGILVGFRPRLLFVRILPSLRMRFTISNTFYVTGNAVCICVSCATKPAFSKKSSASSIPGCTEGTRIGCTATLRVKEGVSSLLALPSIESATLIFVMLLKMSLFFPRNPSSYSVYTAYHLSRCVTAFLNKSLNLASSFAFT